MKISDLHAAFDLPPGASVDQRVPKKMLVENGAPTAVDKRRITEGIEEIHWLAALKPTTIGVPEYRDEVREYLEIAVLSVVLRLDAKALRLAELVHRAVPYPVVLLMAKEEGLLLSLAHKRWSQGEADKTVLDGEQVSVDLDRAMDAALVRQFMEALPLARHPQTSLHALYQSWMDTCFALKVAQLSGVFTLAATSAHAEERRTALQECGVLETRIAALCSAAVKEKQIHRQVELNLELKRLQAAQAALRAKL